MDKPENTYLRACKNEYIFIYRTDSRCWIPPPPYIFIWTICNSISRGLNCIFICKTWGKLFSYKTWDCNNPWSTCLIYLLCSNAYHHVKSTFNPQDINTFLLYSPETKLLKIETWINKLRISVNLSNSFYLMQWILPFDHFHVWQRWSALLQDLPGYKISMYCILTLKVSRVK